MGKNHQHAKYQEQLSSNHLQSYTKRASQQNSKHGELIAFDYLTSHLRAGTQQQQRPESPNLQ